MVAVRYDFIQKECLMFKAILVDKVDGKPRAQLTELDDSALPDEDVLVDVAYSSLNYKDGLALTGGPICRRFPMVAGIDLAGTVVESRADRYRPGDRVVVNGWGLSETHWGGFSQKQRLSADWLTRVPEAFSLHDAMVIGTAGYTAMLCVLALEDHGLAPDAGDVLVTGAAGGVGSVAIMLLSALGYTVVASSGRPQLEAYLRDLGAGSVIDRALLSEPGKPFQKERWAGAVDSIGSHTLANVLAQIRYGGTVSACGLAGGNDLPASVLPFILRAVKLIGIDSVMAPQAVRERAWSRLARDLDKAKLGTCASTEPMSKLPELARAIVAGQTRGRVVIDVNA